LAAEQPAEADRCQSLFRANVAQRGFAASCQRSAFSFMKESGERSAPDQRTVEESGTRKNRRELVKDSHV
jgi:hypothetical protein